MFEILRAFVVLAYVGAYAILALVVFGLYHLCMWFLA